jgi:acetate kinase
MNILILNAGSSSQKSCLYDWARPARATAAAPLVGPNRLD